MIEDASKNFRYDKHLYSHFRTSICSVCKNTIEIKEEHIVEAWQGELAQIESRRIHKDCFKYVGEKEIIDIELPE